MKVSLETPDFLLCRLAAAEQRTLAALELAHQALSLALPSVRTAAAMTEAACVQRVRARYHVDPRRGAIQEDGTLVLPDEVPCPDPTKHASAPAGCSLVPEDDGKPQEPLPPPEPEWSDVDVNLETLKAIAETKP